MTDSALALEASHVSFAYDHRLGDVVDDVTVAVPHGGVVGLLGPNGSGKTTVLRLLSGTMSPRQGRIAIDGARIETLSRRELARLLAVVPQETHSTFDFSVLEIVLMGRYAHLGRFEVEGAGDVQIAREALAATGTTAFEGRRFAALSGGEKQRVVIAGALAQAGVATGFVRPGMEASGILLLDEPTASLDLGFQLEIAALLSRLNRERNVTLVVSTHDLNLAATLCTELVLMKDGRVVAHGPTGSVLTADNVRSVYGVEADVGAHARARHLTVVPLARIAVAGNGDAGLKACATTAAPTASGGRAAVQGRQHSDVRRRLAWTVAAFGALAAASCLFAPVVGSTPLSLSRAFSRSIPFADNVDAQVFFVARLPRVVAAAVVGSGMAVAGVVFQALLRNPLASPDTLGVSAGATLGAMLAITFHVDVAVLGVTAVPLASFLGSAGALGIVYALAAARRRGTSSTVLILAGVALSAFLGALVRLIQVLADFTDTFRSIRWMMGSLDVASYAPITMSLVPMAAAFACVASLPRILDLISMGAEAAAARGVDVRRAERIALVSASLSTGAAVSLGGPVPFVGIIVPHIVRLMVGADHRLVLPASALFGASFLIICDLVARTAFGPVELPVGTITAILGGPFFLWLLFRRLA
jgi:iron complex transport system permease protein